MNCPILRDTAIRKKFDTVHVATVIRSEEDSYAAHIIGASQATERNVGSDSGHLLVRHKGRQAGGINMADSER